MIKTVNEWMSEWVDEFIELKNRKDCYLKTGR